ncbi:MAG: hypothetical protein ACLQNE_30040 [Thermoguttaceae bacterium]
MRNVVWIVAMLAGVMLVASQASAQTAKQAAKQARRAARQAAMQAAAQSVTPASSAVVAALKSAHALLVTADRDYDGHRAKAAKEVHQALRALGYHAAASTASVSTPSSKVHEAQATSDAQLLQAQQILQGVAGQVSTGHVATAINEINKALTIR